MRASKDNTIHYQLDPAHPPKLTPAQAKRLKATPIDYSDIPELPEDFWARHPPATPHTKRQITLRLDSDVVEFFRAQGGHYQTRINAVLRTYVDSVTRLRAGAQGRRSDPSADPKTAKASRPAHGGKGRASRGGGQRHP